MSLICSKCTCAIHSRDNLVVAVDLYKLAPFCPACWSQNQKSFLGQMLTGVPFNGSQANITTGIAALLVIAFIFYQQYIYSALCILIIVLRFLSFWFFERRVN